MKVLIMQIVLTAALSLGGATPAWCDACGEMYDASTMTQTASGLYCPDCCEAWNY